MVKSPRLKDHEEYLDKSREISGSKTNKRRDLVPI